MPEAEIAATGEPVDVFEVWPVDAITTVFERVVVLFRRSEMVAV